jgi:glyoxylase-like metal-dependent hydrolase (beta-lactamase superfamily II)
MAINTGRKNPGIGILITRAILAQINSRFGCESFLRTPFPDIRAMASGDQSRYALARHRHSRTTKRFPMLALARLTVLAALLACTSVAAIEIGQLRSGVWAALQPENNRFNDCNSLIVEADDYVIVVDAQESASDVAQIIEFVQDETGKPVRFLVNTHWHGDHTQGNTLYRDVYGDGLVIIGHETQAVDIPERAATSHAERVAAFRDQLPAARAQLETGVKLDGSRFTDEELAAQTVRVERAEAWLAANEDVVFTGPTLTISDALNVDADSASFTVFPQRGHTRGDLIVYFPRLQVLAAGDLVDVMPYSGHGYPLEWLAALELIDALDFSTIVPGHGTALYDRKLIANLTSYFDSLTSQVALLAAKGNDLESIRDAIDLSSSRKLLAGDDEAAARFFDRVQDEAIERAYAEVTGSE